MGGLLHKALRGEKLPTISNLLLIAGNSVTPLKANFMHASAATEGELKL
jgi:hypothetical protein